MTVDGTRPTARFVGLSVAAVLVLTGCSGTAAEPASDGASAAATQPPLSELNVLDDPKAYEGPSTAVLHDTAIIPVAEDPQETLGTAVVSHDLDGDVEVEVTDASRVIALDLSGSIAATVWGLGFGDMLVGRDQSTTFPGTEDLPVVTSGAHSVNAEAVIALRPTLVITDGTIGPIDVVQQLRDVGIAVVFVENEASFVGAEELARQVGAVFGTPELGDQLADHIADEIDAKIAEIAQIVPDGEGTRLRIVFLYLRGSAGVYYLFGPESGADQLIEALGGIDVLGELGWDGMRPMTDEAMVEADPDLILVMTKGIDSVGGVDGLMADKPAIALTTAGQNRRFVDMEDGEILSFGPRSAGILDALARAIYAPEGAGLSGNDS